MRSQPATSGNYLIVAELRAASSTKFEAALALFGAVVRVNQTVWLLKSEAALASVRNHLRTCTSDRDMLFIVDVGSGRRAWCNVSMPLEAQLRAIWAPKGDGIPSATALSPSDKREHL